MGFLDSLHPVGGQDRNDVRRTKKSVQARQQMVMLHPQYSIRDRDIAVGELQPDQPIDRETTPASPFVLASVCMSRVQAALGRHA
jgi:hypothetical protein